VLTSQPPPPPRRTERATKLSTGLILASEWELMFILILRSYNGTHRSTGKAVDLYSESSRFESQSGHRLSLQSFSVVFWQSLQASSPEFRTLQAVSCTTLREAVLQSASVKRSSVSHVPGQPCGDIHITGADMCYTPNRFVQGLLSTILLRRCSFESWNPRCTPVRDLHTAFSLPHAHDYITKLCRQQAEVVQNHEN
jgi:hypothetical protein